MSVVDTDAPVRSPPRVADAAAGFHSRAVQRVREVADRARDPDALDARLSVAVLDEADARRVVAAVFKPR